MGESQLASQQAETVIEEIRSSTVRDLLYWLLRRRHRFRVVGNSMLPLLKPGDELLVDPSAYCHALPKLGEIVIAQHPNQINVKLVKRVTAILANGQCRLQGDNSAESTDQEVEASYLLGRVTSRFG